MCAKSSRETEDQPVEGEVGSLKRVLIEEVESSGAKASRKDVDDALSVKARVVLREESPASRSSKCEPPTTSVSWSRRIPRNSAFSRAMRASVLVVDATVQGDIDTEGQAPHVETLAHTILANQGRLAKDAFAKVRSSGVDVTKPLTYYANGLSPGSVPRTDSSSSIPAVNRITA